MPKETQECLKEFENLRESEQSAYLFKHGAYATTNAGTFPNLPFAGTVITTHSGTLNGFYALRNRSEIDMKKYTDEVKLCVGMMEQNYNNIDDVADGNGAVIALAGVNSSSTNTTRTAPPSTPANLKYVFVDDAGQIMLTSDLDKLAWGSIILTYTDDTVTVEKVGDMQILVTTGPPSARVEVLIDLSTTIKTLIKNLTKKTEINSVVGLFNPNGLSPLASPAPVVVPR